MNRKNDIEHPVQLVLDRPVAANGLREAFHFHGQAAEIKLDFVLLHALNDTTMNDHAEAAEVFPGRGSRQVLRHRHLIISTFLLATVFGVICREDAIAGF